MMKPNYLSLGGYRLPTEAELEYACLPGGRNDGSIYGETEELLKKTPGTWPTLRIGRGPWEASSQTILDCSTCSATSLAGVRIGNRIRILKPKANKLLMIKKTAL